MSMVSPLCNAKLTDVNQGSSRDELKDDSRYVIAATGYFVQIIYFFIVVCGQRPKNLLELFLDLLHVLDT